MDTKKMNELRELFKATASVGSDGEQAFREFCAAIRTPILQEVKLLSVARELFSTEVLGPGAQAIYPVADDFDLSVHVLPGLGYVAQQFIEGAGEDVVVPVFTIDTAADWKLSYAQEGRVDIAAKAVSKAAQAIAEYEEESAWRILAPAATTNFSATGLLAARSAPIYEVAAGSSGAGYFSPELVNEMVVGFQRLGRTLTDLWISPEDSADIRLWSETQLDPISRRDVFVAGGMGSLWGIKLHVLPHLGAQGKFNINSSSSSFGIFQADGAGDFGDYHLDNPNTVDANGEVSTLGETQIYGFDMSVNDSLVMPIKEEFQTWDDPALHREQKQGFYGWERVGFACLDSRMLGMGVIDRSL